MFEDYIEIETIGFHKLISNPTFRKNPRYTNNGEIVLVDFPNYLAHENIEEFFMACKYEINQNFENNLKSNSLHGYLERTSKLFIDFIKEINIDDSSSSPYWDSPRITAEFLSEYSGDFYRQGVSVKLESYRYKATVIVKYIEERINQLKEANLSSKVLHSNYSKLKWNGQAKELATIFYELMFVLKNDNDNTTYLEQDITNVATFISENFVQKDGVSFSFSSVKTSLTPSKQDKRSSKGKSITF